MMTEFPITSTKELTSTVKSTPVTLKLSGKIIDNKTMVSKKGNEYQIIIFADNTGTRSIINCTNNKLEINQNYDLTVKASKKNPYNLTLFLDQSKVTSKTMNINPVPDQELEWLNEHITLKELVVKTASPVKTEDIYTTLDKSLGNYDSNINDSEDLLLKMEDEEGKVYYYRLWHTDNMVAPSDITPGVILKFKHIAINKQKGSSSPRNIIKSPLFTCSLVE